MPWTRQEVYTRHKELHANISVIALGTNDSKPVNWTSTAPERFKKDYISLIEEFQAYPSRPEIYMMIPIRAYDNTMGIDDNVIANEIRPVMREISKEMGIAVIDGYTPMYNTSHLLSDGVHPNDEGLKIIAEKIASVILTHKPLIVENGKPSEVIYDEYRWYKDGVLIPEAASATYSATEPGRYKVAVKLEAGTDDIVVSENFEVKGDHPITLVISDEEESSGISVGNNTTMNVLNRHDNLLVENAVGLQLFLYDLYGKILKETSIVNSSQSINISELSGGIYIYKIGNSNGKFIK